MGREKGKKDQQSENCLYFDMSKQERDSAIRYLLGTIINTRNQCHFPSNYYTFDEDVNIYLAHLLFAVSLPEYHEMAEPYLSMDTSDVLRWVRATEDKTIRYFIFKVNADHLLIHTAVFDDLLAKQNEKVFKKSEKHYREIAKLYYDQASSYHRRIYRKKTGVGEVLGKLSQYFDKYQDMLKEVRRDYFHFLNSFRDQVFHQFLHQIKNYETDMHVKTKMDHFLDLYGRWLMSKDPELKEKITHLVAEIRMSDPEFKFDFSKLGDEGEGFYDERKCA